MLKQLTPLAAGVVALGGFTAADAAEILVNFGDTNYTTDGTNTWQTLDVNGSASGSTAGTVNTTPLALVDTGGNATGITLTLSQSGNPDVFSRADDGTNTSETFTWFDSSVAAQNESYAFGGETDSITYTLTGFLATDTVTIEGLSFRAGSGTRRVDVISSVNGTIVDDGVTNDGDGVTFTDAGLTGATSYSIELQKSFPADGFPSALNALRIDVTPIPEPGSLALLGLGTLLMIGRSRRA